MSVGAHPRPLEVEVMEPRRTHGAPLAAVALLVGGCLAEPEVEEIQLSERPSQAVAPYLLDGFQIGPEGTVDLEEGDESGWAARDLVESEASLALARAPRTVPAPPSDLVDMFDRQVEADPAARAEDGRVRITVQVAGQVELPRGLSTLDGSSRGQAIEAAESQAGTLQRDVRQFIDRNGGTVTASLWLGNSIQAEVPSRLVDELRSRADVIAITANASVRMSTYDGDQLRNGTGAAGLIATGVNGDPPGAFRTRLGFVEASGGNNWPLESHPAYQDLAPSNSARYQQVFDCNACTNLILGVCYAWGCLVKTAPVVQQLHATFVSSIAAGSVEQGQDPLQTTTTARVQRSGMASETDLFHYGVNDCDAMGRAIQRAVVDGVNVLNVSAAVGPTSAWCSRTFDCGGVSSAIRSAFNSGTNIIVANGNNGNPGSCNLEFPAYRPEVVGVGALDSSGSTTSYTSLPFATYSSAGGMTIRYSSGSSQTMSGVGLVAPGDYVLRPNVVGPPAGYVATWSLQTSGTSFATPVVTGGAALFIDAARRSGITPDARSVLANLLLMGDRWTGSGSGVLVRGVHNSTGMGRFVQRAPGYAPFAGSGVWGWGGANLMLSTGTNQRTVGSTGPETGVASWRWVTTAFADDLNDVPVDYLIRAVDTCRDPGMVIDTDASFDLRKRISLNASQICPAGGGCRCIRMDIVVLSSPAGGANIVTTDFYAGVAL